MINTHPDYMNFKGGRLAREEYPAELYKEFLEYVIGKYKGKFWHVLPRQVSAFWKNLDQRNSSIVKKEEAGS